MFTLVDQVMPMLTMETYDIGHSSAGGTPNCDLLPAGPLLLEDIFTTPRVAAWGKNEPQDWGVAAACGWNVSLQGSTLSATPPSRNFNSVVEA